MPSNTYTITDINGETGVTIERKPTADELAQIAIDEAAANQAAIAAAAKAAAKQAVLDKLGLSAEEMAALLG